MTKYEEISVHYQKNHEKYMQFESTVNNNLDKIVNKLITFLSCPLENIKVSTDYIDQNSFTTKSVTRSVSITFPYVINYGKPSEEVTSKTLRFDLTIHEKHFTYLNTKYSLTNKGISDFLDKFWKSLKNDKRVFELQ
jgi:hypothetical protein